MSFPLPARGSRRVSPAGLAAQGERRTTAQVWAFTVGVWLVYTVYCLGRYPQFLAAGYDLGIFDQAVRRYSRFEAPLVALKGDNYNILGDHFHPILATLAPLYWIWDDPRVLVIAQAALVCLSIPVVARMLRRHGAHSWLLWVLLVGYALSWPLQRLVDFDFHEICFAIPLLALALDGLDRRDDRRLLLASLPLLLVREDMGMVLAMLGLARILLSLRDRRDGTRRDLRRSLALGSAMMLLGVVVFALVVKVVLPHFAPSGQFAYWSYDALGPDAFSSIRFILLHPLRTAEIFFFPWEKSRGLLYLLLPLAFVAVRSPMLLATLPLLAQRNLSSRTHLWGTAFHYSAPIFVILVFATADAMSRLGPAWRRRLAAFIVAMVAITPAFDLAVQGRNYPLVRLFWSSWQRKPIMEHQRAVLTHIPPNTCVEVDDRLAVHLTRTNRVTLPTLTRRTSDFVVIDMSQDEVGYPLPSPATVEDLLKSKEYTPVAKEGSITVWQRPGYSGPSEGCGPDAP
ncbi:DUF2079 domain-containing protein [Luteococcus sediminum]